MTIAAAFRKAKFIKVIGQINPDLVKERDRYGWNAMTKAANVLSFGVMNQMSLINPELLTEPDGNGWNAYSFLISLIVNVSFLCSFFFDKQVDKIFSKYGVSKGVSILCIRALLNFLSAKLRSNIVLLLFITSYSLY